MTADAEVTAKPDAKTFDINAFLGKFTPANWTVRVPTQGELVPEMDRLFTEIAEYDQNAEEAVGDKRSKVKLVMAYNKLVAEFEQSSMEFTFRPSVLADHVAARKAFTDNGGDLAADYVDEGLSPYLWAQTCIEPPGVTADGFFQLKSLIGDIPLRILHAAWLKANNGGSLVDAPFSPRPLPIPTSEKRSKS